MISVSGVRFRVRVSRSRVSRIMVVGLGLELVRLIRASGP